MTILPPSLSYGHVKARFLASTADGPDAGRMPDAVALVGTARFMPGFRYQRGSDGTIVLMEPVTVPIAAGDLVDKEGGNGIWLLTGDYTVMVYLTGYPPMAASFTLAADSTEADPLLVTFLLT